MTKGYYTENKVTAPESMRWWAVFNWSMLFGVNSNCQSVQHIIRETPNAVAQRLAWYRSAQAFTLRCVMTTSLNVTRSRTSQRSLPVTMITHHLRMLHYKIYSSQYADEQNDHAVQRARQTKTLHNFCYEIPPKFHPLAPSCMSIAWGGLTVV